MKILYTRSAPWIVINQNVICIKGNNVRESGKAFEIDWRWGGVSVTILHIMVKK